MPWLGVEGGRSRVTLNLAAYSLKQRSTALQDIELSAIERSCARLVTLYCHLIDHGTAAQAGDLFSEDAVWISREKVMNGRAEITQSFAAREANAGRMSRHVCSTSLLDVRGPTEARGVTYLTLYRDDGALDRRVSQVRGPAMVGEYRDHFVLTEVGWRIQRREVIIDFIVAGEGR